MNVFHKVALQGLRRNRTRTFVTVVGVALSAALITAVATFVVSLQTYMVNGAIAKYGDWQVAFVDVDSPFAQEQAKDPRVAKVVSFENIGYAMLDGGKTPTSHIGLSPGSATRPTAPCPSNCSPAGSRKTARKSWSRPMPPPTAASG